jgi:recombination protein RecT
MNAQSTAIAEQREQPPLVVLKSQLEERAESFRMALPSHIKPEDLQRTVLMAAQQNPTILQADRRSLILSCMKAAQDGLLPDGREAALVPFNTREKDGQGKWVTVKQVQYMPMVYGLRKKIMQSDEISVMQVGVVYRAEYESGRFLFELGMEPPIRYRPDLSLSVEETEDGEIVAAFSLVKFKDGSWSAEVMRRAEINKIRQLSQTGAVGQVVKFGANKGKPIEPKGPWVDHFAEMAKKTVMRRHSKVLPMSGDIFRDVEGEEIDRAARSAVAALDSVEPDEPVALPSGEELDEQDSGEAVDAETGEIKTDPNTGLTEVDEETARKLDAGEESGGDDDEGE